MFEPQLRKKSRWASKFASAVTKLLEISKELQQRYGSLSVLLRQSKNRKDLETRLQEFKGVGPVTTRIFLREFKAWSKNNRK